MNKFKGTGLVWPVVVCALILVLGSAEAGKSKNRPLPANSTEVKSLCSELLTRAELITAVDVQGAPGLKILVAEIDGAKPDYQSLLRLKTDSFHPHELISSARYARHISEYSGETLLMVPGIEHKSIPGFDGVIFNAEGMPIANYSLKTLLTATGEHTPLDRAKDGASKARKFSFVERWLLMLKLIVQDESGQLRIAHDMSSGQEREVKDWLGKSLKLFGVRAPAERKRPTRIVIDIQTDVPLPRDVDVTKMKALIQDSQGLIESIVIIKDGQVIEIK